MRNSAITTPMSDQTGQVKLAVYAKWWALWKEPLAGFLIVVGLCWSLMLPSMLSSIHWWMVLPFAVCGALLRQRNYPRSWKPIVPLWAFFFVVLFFALYAAAFNPLSDYGHHKFTNFSALAFLAYIAARKQAPLTEEFVKGIRWGLFASMALGLLEVYHYRELFFNQQLLGIEQLNQAVTVALLPMAISMSVMACLPRTSKTYSLLLGGILLLLGATLNVFTRGRFQAILLAILAIVLVVGPPWRNIFWRMITIGVLAVIGSAFYINVLPLLGDSFLYLTWVSPESLAGRGPAWEIAIRGFWMHPLGLGIGSFRQSGGWFPYPHNIILESAYELGILGLASLSAVYLAVFRRFIQLWMSPPHRILAAVLLVVFMHMLKSGDISTLAFHWVFLYLLIVCTPCSKTWPLEQSRRAD